MRLSLAQAASTAVVLASRHTERSVRACADPGATLMGLELRPTLTKIEGNLATPVMYLVLLDFNTVMYLVLIDSPWGPYLNDVYTRRGEGVPKMQM